MSNNNIESFRGGSRSESTNPNEPLGFEIDPLDKRWSFIPEYYPEDFTGVKKKKLDRHGSGCEGESVSIEKVKNREFHVAGKILRGELVLLQKIQDHDGVVDLISPLIKNGGIECYVKRAERGNESGWDPFFNQRHFEYDMDLVSTGEDEYGRGDNGIVSEIIDSDIMADLPGSYHKGTVDIIKD